MPVPAKFDMSDAIPIQPEGGVPAKFDMSDTTPIAPTAPTAKPLGPLDTLSAWGQKTFAPISREDAKKSESDALNPARSPAPEVARDVANAGGAMMRTITGAPAALADWLKIGPLTPRQSGQEMVKRANEAGGQAVPKVAPTVSAETANDFGAETAGNLAGGALLGEVGGEALTSSVKGVGKVLRVPKTIARSLAESATETSPRHVAKMVAESSEKNAVEAASHADATQDALRATKEKEDLHAHDIRTAQEDAANKRRVDLKKHFDDTQKIKQANENAAKLNSRKTAIERGVEKSDEPLRDDLKKTLKEVKGEADRRYNIQRKELNDKQIPFDGKAAEDSSIVTGENFAEKAKDAWSSTITGSDTLPPIIKSIQDRVNVTQPITWRDLQGYRSEIGRKLSGDLPGDEYYAYKKVLGVIDDGMQKIADQNGMGKQIRADRAFYRQYMDTFRDPSSPVYKALNAKERGGTVKALQGADRSGIEAIAPYNKELPKKLNTLRNLQSEASTLPAKVTPKELPKLSPKAETKLPAPPDRVEHPDRPQERVISPSTLAEMKKTQLDASASKMQQPNRLASTFLGFDLNRNLIDAAGHTLSGNWGSAASDLLKATRDIAIRMSYGVETDAFADALKDGRIRDKLGAVTEKDVEAIRRLPADQQKALAQNFFPLVEAAQKKGVKVSSPLAAFVGAAAASKRTETNNQNQ